jgi:hypothetical protein
MTYSFSEHPQSHSIVRELIFERAERVSQQFFSYEKIFESKVVGIARFGSRECASCTHLGRKAWFSSGFFEHAAGSPGSSPALIVRRRVVRSVVGNFARRLDAAIF